MRTLRVLLILGVAFAELPASRHAMAESGPEDSPSYEPIASSALVEAGGLKIADVASLAWSKLFGKADPWEERCKTVAGKKLVSVLNVHGLGPPGDIEVPRPAQAASTFNPLKRVLSLDWSSAPAFREDYVKNCPPDFNCNYVLAGVLVILPQETRGDKPVCVFAVEQFKFLNSRHKLADAAISGALNGLEMGGQTLLREKLTPAR